MQRKRIGGLMAAAFAPFLHSPGTYPLSPDLPHAPASGPAISFQ